MMSVMLLLLQCCYPEVAAQNKDEKDEIDKKEEKTSQPTSSAPSKKPTAYPTSSSAPTALPSASPSAQPTPFLSTTPTSTPTVKNTLKAEVYGALIPIMTFDILLSDDDGLLPMTRDMNAFFTMFLDRVLDENSDGFDFDYSHLDSNVIVSSFQSDNHQRRQRRRLEKGYSVQVDGIAYFFGEAPTRAALKHSMKLYFNFWGTTDLEDYFQRLGMTSAKVVFIAIDEVPLDAFNKEDSAFDPAGATIASGTTSQTEDEGPSFPRIVAIGIYIGAISLIPAAALAVLLCKRRKRQQEKKKADYWKRSNVLPVSASESSHSEISPRPTNTLQQPEEDEVKSLSSGLISDDLSVYATRDALADNHMVYGSETNDFDDRSALVIERRH